MRPTLLAALMFTATSAMAQAQDAVANGQKFGAWTVNCTAVAVGRTVCTLQQQILRSSDRAFIAQMLAFQSPDRSKTYLSARVPNGVYFPAGFVMKDEQSEDVLQFVWQSCGRDLCEALAEIDPEALADMAGTDKVILGAFRPNIQSENFVFRMSLNGAPEGLAALANAAEPSE